MERTPPALASGARVRRGHAALVELAITAPSQLPMKLTLASRILIVLFPGSITP